MCLVLTATHPRWPLVVAANRDEWLERPARPLHRWPDGLLAGRDELAGGTWLAVNERGAFAVVTNVREPGTSPGPRSRGDLPLAVLRAASLERGVRDACAEGRLYSGFHVLAGRVGELWHTSNRGEPPTRLAPGLHGISNGPRAAPWPKVVDGLAAVEATLRLDDEDRLVEALLGVLADRTTAEDDRLPETGVGLELERALSARFVATPRYGTRCSTVLIVTPGRVRLVEQGHAPVPGRVDLAWSS